MNFKMIGAATALVLFAAGSVSAATVNFAGTLKASDEVPANTSAGTGDVKASLDTATKVLTYTVNYSGLSGPAGAAHFHGLADPGANAGPVVMVTVSPSPIKGTATLTDAQIADLTAGKWYFNIHTAANRGGEVRAQLKATK